MNDLFDLPLIPGLRSVPGFVDADEERALIGRLDSLALAPFRPPMAPRNFMRSRPS